MSSENTPSSTAFADALARGRQAPDNGTGKDRSWYLEGSKDDIERSKELIIEIVSSKSHELGRPGGPTTSASAVPKVAPGSTSVDMTIPGPKVGLIIGKGGETIRSLQNKSGTKMYILQDNMFEECDKPLRIVGEPDLVENARQLVMGLLAKWTPDYSKYLTPVRPESNCLTLSPAQMDLLSKKKKTFADIQKIQQILGRATTNPIFENVELKRKVQQSNTKDFPLPGISDYHDRIRASVFKMEWVKPRNLKELSNQKYFWIDSNDMYWFMHHILKREEILAVDIEANEWDSYGGIVCLIQISTSEHNFLVDALRLPQEISTHLKLIFEDANILKIMHGAGNDLRWLQRCHGIMIWPLVDTQYFSIPVRPESNNLMSFGDLVMDVLHIKISKVEKSLGQLSDYRRRPLHEALKIYAINDSCYLRMAFNILMTNGFSFQNAFEQTKAMAIKAIWTGKQYPTASKEMPSSLSAAEKIVFQDLHKWRDNKAKSLDFQPKTLVPTHCLAAIAVGSSSSKIPHGLEMELLEAAGAKSPTTKGTNQCFRCGLKDCVAVFCSGQKKAKADVRKEYYAANPGKEEQERARLAEKQRRKRHAKAAAKLSQK